MVGLLLAAVFQIKTGQSANSARVMSYGLYVTQAVAMGLGAILCLVSAVVAKVKPWDSLGLSLAGMVVLSMVFAFYATLQYTNLPNPLVSVSFWFVLSLFGGVCTRAIQLAWLALRIARYPK
jgi:hypothetical protein